jgi:hypothetical protein
LMLNKVGSSVELLTLFFLRNLVKIQMLTNTKMHSSYEPT